MTQVSEPVQGNAAGVRLWGGRFASGPAQAVAQLSVSVGFDWRLAIMMLSRRDAVGE
jgi:argininosuccinate lyase